MTNRSMTAGEQALATSVFKKQIDFSKVKIYNKKWALFQPDDTVMAPNGNIYYPPVHSGYTADISTLSVHNKALLIHELTHVWQDQHGVNVTLRGIFERDYDYLPITVSTVFGDLGIEEQGDLVRDYYYQTQGYRNKVWPPLSVYITVIPWLP